MSGIGSAHGWPPEGNDAPPARHARHPDGVTRRARALAVATAMQAVSTGRTVSAAVSDDAEASSPMMGGPKTKPTQPQADTIAIAVPGFSPGSTFPLTS